MIQQMDDLANRLLAAGLIKDACAKEGFYQRLASLYVCMYVSVTYVIIVRSWNPPTNTFTKQPTYRMASIEKQYPGASVLLHKKGELPPSFQQLWQDPRLLDMAQQLLGGPEIDVAGHPGR